VGHLVRQNVREERIEFHIGPIPGGEHPRGNGLQNPGKLGLLHVLEHHALRPHRPHDALVIGQIESGGTDPVRAIAGGQNLIDHSNRRERSQLGIAVLGVQRQVVLNLLKMIREHLQLGRLLLIAQRHISFKRGLVSEQVVVVCLVGPDGHVDGRVELHPRHVARVIVVAQERLSPQMQEILERGVGASRPRPD
jgi:hypothetical protein